MHIHHLLLDSHWIHKGLICARWWNVFCARCPSFSLPQIIERVCSRLQVVPKKSVESTWLEVWHAILTPHWLWFVVVKNILKLFGQLRSILRWVLVSTDRTLTFVKLLLQSISETPCSSSIAPFSPENHPQFFLMNMKIRHLNAIVASLLAEATIKYGHVNDWDFDVNVDIVVGLGRLLLSSLMPAAALIMQLLSVVYTVDDFVCTLLWLTWMIWCIVHCRRGNALELSVGRRNKEKTIPQWNHADSLGLVPISWPKSYHLGMRQDQ